MVRALTFTKIQILGIPRNCNKIKGVETTFSHIPNLSLTLTYPPTSKSHPLHSNNVPHQHHLHLPILPPPPLHNPLLHRAINPPHPTISVLLHAHRRPQRTFPSGFHVLACTDLRLCHHAPAGLPLWSAPVRILERNLAVSENLFGDYGCVLGDDCVAKCSTVSEWYVYVC